ncbi:2,4-dihydroxyhept-2-ene-1,7-dioic acid aldolase [Oceanispirochaeta crateris]|uniref:2,4-dihydroxyhept-2-ene-1,7-dioic acid aldolase n=1 Tax=Oceanispirochaeta crateris TaxID=2518645 RepID=A0A5C1QTW0_9SPIO|nr:aldolase/citrate lyase family protein [Oceanispirochaeta crateris]QEN09472.1 2,4-dihydroxyhept-2-ene-1,7-dioic acid aldolase [Oceanispirochaeta crateris]
MLKKNQNDVKTKLQNGKKVLGAWAQAGSNITAEVMADSGMDFIIIDMEHSPIDLPVLVTQFQAMNGYPAVPFVRAPWNDFVQIKRILDAGAFGIIIPNVETVEEAKKAISAVKYPMAGIRGVAGSTRAAHYGNDSLSYFVKANEEVMLILMIESPRGIENLDEILKLEGFDGIMVGPVDLATTMGYLGNPEVPEAKQALESIEKKVIASGKYLMALSSDWEGAKNKFAKGAHLVTCMSDTLSLGVLARKNVDRFSEIYS